MSRGTVVRLEDLVGARVVDAKGRRVGHIEEVRAARHDGEYEIEEYLLGTAALLERWSAFQNLFGIKPRKLIARWNQLDISDARRPRLTCPRDELAAVEKAEKKS
jgi:hypothetical protein